MHTYFQNKKYIKHKSYFVNPTHTREMEMTNVYIIKGGKCKAKGAPFEALWSQREFIILWRGWVTLKGKGPKSIVRKGRDLPVNRSVFIFLHFDCFAVIFISISESVYLHLFYYAPFDECVIVGSDLLLKMMFIFNPVKELQLGSIHGLNAVIYAHSLVYAWKFDLCL